MLSPLGQPCHLASQYVWASHIIAVLFTVIVSYVIIALIVKRKTPPYSSGAVSSYRKLTVTLLVVIVLSTVTFRLGKIYCHVFGERVYGLFSASPRIAIVGTPSCDPISFQTLFNVGMGLLQGRCLHLALSCHPGIFCRHVFPDFKTRQQIHLGFAHNSCAFHRHCLLCDNYSECKKKSSSILIWCSVIRKETYSHVIGCHCSQHT